MNIRRSYDFNGYYFNCDIFDLMREVINMTKGQDHLKMK